MRLEWSASALADLDRFATFLHEKFPSFAPLVARTLIEKSQELIDNPQIGRPISGSAEFRQIVIHAMRAAYVLQYRIDGDRIVILRVFHGRESRS